MMATCPQADIIIPAYNVGDVIARVLADLARQPGIDDCSVIVVNDGSTDDTAAVLARIERPRLTIVHQSNQGRAAARNAGLRQAVADIVLFLDADILAGERWLERHLAAQHAQPGVVMGPITQVDSDASDGLYDLAAIFQGYSGTDRLAWACVTAASLSIPHRAAIVVGGFDEQFSSWGPEDLELAFRLSQAGLTTRALGGSPSVHLRPRRGAALDRARVFEQLAYFHRKHAHPEVRAYVQYVTGKLSCEELYAATTGEPVPSGRTYFRPGHFFSETAS
jgi:glycosyltransferase involved in cell wall biosynthesis